MTHPDAEQTGTSAQMLDLADYIESRGEVLLSSEGDPVIVAALRTAASQDARPGADAVALADEKALFAEVTKVDLSAALRHIRDWMCYIDDHHRQKYADLMEAQAKLIAFLVDRAQPSPGVLTGFDAGGKAQEALEPYCQHLQICSSRDPLFHSPCDCGLETALATPQSAPALAAPQNTAERMPNRETALAGADAVALADKLEDFARRGAKYEANCAMREAAALLHTQLAARDTLLDRQAQRLASARKALDQIKGVCEDNAPASCDKGMALDFVRQVATAALAAPQPQAERVLRHHANETLEESEYLRAQSQAGASEPVGYLLEKAGINNGYYFVSPAEYQHVEERFQNLYRPVYATPSPTATGQK